MATRADAIITAGLRPELFAERGAVSVNRTLLAVLLSVIVLVGFGFRVSNLSAEGLSEDELNKLQAVAEYREHGPTSANSEHPLLMKALLTASVVAAEYWNETGLTASNPQMRIPSETALRLPGAIYEPLEASL